MRLDQPGNTETTKATGDDPVSTTGAADKVIATIPVVDSAGPRSITANQLRWLAEDCDAKRGKSLALAWDGDTLAVVEADNVLAKSAQFRVSTDFDGPGLQGDARLQVLYAGKAVDIHPEADAVFLTQSAVEKFVLPYYTRFKTPRAIDYLKAKLFGKGKHGTGKRIIAAFHIPPSVSFRVEVPPTVEAVAYDEEHELLIPQLLDEPDDQQTPTT